MKPDPSEVYHYSVMEWMRKVLWVMGICWPILLVLHTFTDSDLPMFAAAAILFTCGIYFFAAYSFLFLHYPEVLRTFKMFSKNIHPLLEKSDAS